MGGSLNFWPSYFARQSQDFGFECRCDDWPGELESWADRRKLSATLCAKKYAETASDRESSPHGKLPCFLLVNNPDVGLAVRRKRDRFGLTLMQ